MIPESIYLDLTPIAHGYTAAAAARIAHVAATHRPGTDLEERHAIALCAIVAELRAAAADPGTLHLIRAAEKAVNRERGRDASSRGRNVNPNYDRTHLVGFVRYATPGARTPLDEAVAERVACRQIMAALTDRQRQVLLTLAACDGDPKAAARILVVHRVTVACILRNVRDRFLPLWHEHETPPAIDWSRARNITYSPQALAARRRRQEAKP